MFPETYDTLALKLPFLGVFVKNTHMLKTSEDKYTLG